MIIATILISASFLLGALVLHAMYMHAELKGYERGLDEAEEIMRIERSEKINTKLAFEIGKLHRYDEPMVFDWIKAAKLIKEYKPENVQAGLRDDWEYTGGFIFDEGKISDYDGTYLQSTWAVPEIMLDYGEKIECYVMKNERPEWDECTFWPQEAIDILNAV